MINNTYNRYLWLLNTLLINKRLTLRELSDRWRHSSLYDGVELSSRTFFKHRHAVEEIFQVGIRCDTSCGNVYYIEGADSMHDDRAKKWMLNSFNVSEVVKNTQSIRDRVLLEDIPGGVEYLSVVIEALRTDAVLKVEYKSFFCTQPKTYTVEPYCIKVHHQRWYLLVMVREYGELRNLALDRVQGMTVTDDKFRYPKDFSPEAYYEGSVGIWVNEAVKPEPVELRAYGLEGKYLQSLPLHHTQQQVGEGEGYVDFRYHMCVTLELIEELMRKGANFEVLKPQTLRDQMADAARKLLERYV